jgi:beta-phosphoglucomutase-like phosphatase (HAD superfamily)
VESVRLLAKEWPLAVASSSNRHVIDLVVELAGLKEEFHATVSSEEVGSGKPAPDVYLEAARRLEVDPGACAAIEDSTNGIRSARAAGMTVIAVPNRDYPPEAETRGQADRILDSLVDLTPDLVRSLQRSN